MENDSITELITKLEGVHLDTTAAPQMEKKPSTSKNSGHHSRNHWPIASTTADLAEAEPQRQKLNKFRRQLNAKIQAVSEMCTIVDRKMRKTRAFQLVEKVKNMPHTSYHALDSSTSEEEEYEDVDVNKTTKDTTKVAKGNRWKLKRQNAFDKS